jgi:hypothetical protein
MQVGLDDEVTGSVRSVHQDAIGQRHPLLQTKEARAGTR